MSEKHLKEIAKELKLIRKELQKLNSPRAIKIDGSNVDLEEFRNWNGEKITLTSDD